MLTNNLITRPDHPFLGYINDELVARCYPGSGWTFQKVEERFQAKRQNFMLTAPDHEGFALWEMLTPTTYLLECHALDPAASPQVNVDMFSEGNHLMKIFTPQASLLAWMYKPRCPQRLEEFRGLVDWWHLQGAYLLEESLSGRAGLLRLGEVEDDVVRALLPQVGETLTWEPPATLLANRKCSLYSKPHTFASIAS